MFNSDIYPFVSVVVPVRNGEKTIQSCIQSLSEQRYPADKFEIIIVDNGSTDSTVECIKKHSIIFLQTSDIPNAYIARNLGIKNAKGDIIALTDADCTIDPFWIKEGVACMGNYQCNLVGGNIISKPKANSAAEYYDSMCNAQQEEAIDNRGIAFTGNLFVQKEVFESVGLFLESISSGGDTEFTCRATRMGKIIRYTKDSIVYHPSHQFRTLMRKAWVVGRGKGKLAIVKGSIISRPQARAIWFPYLVRRTKKIHGSLSVLMYVKIWLIAWGYLCICCSSYVYAKIVRAITSKDMPVSHI